MNLLAMSGNVQCPDRLFPGMDVGLQVSGASEAESDFALSLQRSQDAVVEKNVERKLDEKSFVKIANADVAVKNASSEITSEKHGEDNKETKENAENIENTSGSKGSNLSVYGVNGKNGNDVASSSVDDSGDSVDRLDRCAFQPIAAGCFAIGLEGSACAPPIKANGADGGDKRMEAMRKNPENIFLFLSLMSAESDQCLEMEPEGELLGNTRFLQTGTEVDAPPPQSGEKNNMLVIPQPEQQVVVGDGEFSASLAHDVSSDPINPPMVEGRDQVVSQDVIDNMPLPANVDVEPASLQQQVKVMDASSGGLSALESTVLSGMSVNADYKLEAQPVIVVPELAPIAKKQAEVDMVAAGDQPAEAEGIPDGTRKVDMISGASVAVFSTAEEQIAAGAVRKTKLLNQPQQEKIIGFSDSPPVREADDPVMPNRLTYELIGRQANGAKGHENSVLSDVGRIVPADHKQSSLVDISVKTDMTGNVGHQPLVSFDSGTGQLPEGPEKTLPVTSDDVLNQVTMRLPDQHSSRQTVTIKLQPESLGKVEIKLVMEQQKLTAHFVVQHSEVRDVLLKHVSSLHDSLVAKGIEVKQVAVEIVPAEKMTGMAVTVDQHSAGGGNQTSDFQQFSPGSEQRQQTFSAQQQSSNESVKTEGVQPSASLLTSGLFLQSGSLHIRA